MHKNNLCLLLGALITINTVICGESLRLSNDFINLFGQIKDDDNFNLTAINEAIQYVDNRAIIGNSKSDSYKGYVGEILNEYAKKLFYGKLNDGDPEIQKAFFFFKLAAEYGNAESHYYLAFYSFYNLDGRFLFKNNLDGLDKRDQLAPINNYVKSMNTSTLINSAFLSNSKGYDLSTYLLGNSFLKGRGTIRSCEKAVSYFKELGQRLFSSDESLMGVELEAYEKRRLDDLYFKEDPSIEIEPLQNNEKEMQYLSMSVSLGKIPEIVKLAETYYYGLKGEKKNLQKAFEYYQKAADRGDIRSKFEVGRMLIKGIGVEKDIQRGVKLLEDVASHGEPMSQNALGELYRNGDGVYKNETAALHYFKEAAKTNYSDALYNYGVSLMSQDKTQIEQAYSYISLAARQGHPLALFQLGLNLIENRNVVGGCEVGASMLKAAIERGPWSEKLKQGFYAYKKKLYKQAALYYMEAALLGQEIASVNAALIIDEFNVFEDRDLDFNMIQSQIIHDPIWLALNKTYQYKLPKDSEMVVYKDLSETLHKMKYSSDKETSVLQTITKTAPKLATKYRQNLILKLLRIGGEDQDPLSHLVLGDAYYTGKLGQKDNKKAYEQYSQIFSGHAFYLAPKVASQTLYNMAYMNHRGLGTPKNLTQAVQFYEMSNQLEKGKAYLSIISKKLAEWESMYIQAIVGESSHADDNIYYKGFFVMKKMIEEFEQAYMKKVIAAVLVLGLTVLYFAKMRLENYMGHQLSKENKRSA